MLKTSVNVDDGLETGGEGGFDDEGPKTNGMAGE
jgi:hypothetical protein